MTALVLASEDTDAGAMERVFLLETADPAQAIYDRTASLKAMRWMKQVVDNRLAAPRKSRFGEPDNASTETAIIAVGNQFAGFGEYPQLSAISMLSSLPCYTSLILPMIDGASGTPVLLPMR